MVLLVALILSSSVYISEACSCWSSCCCTCCHTNFYTNSSRYNIGENVIINFSYRGDCDITFDRLYVTKKSSGWCCEDPEIVFSIDFEEGFEAPKTWNWTWSQINNRGNQVEPGQYTITIATDDCNKLKASFRIYERKDCCNCCERSRCGCCGFFPFLFCCPCN